MREQERKGKKTRIDMPASVENDAEVVAAEIDVRAIYHVTTVCDRDAGDIVAFGEMART